MSDVASKKQSLPLISEPIPNYSFSELILHASRAEHANKHDKQVEIIKERGETRVQLCESTGTAISHKSSRLTNIEFWGWRLGRTVCVVFFFFISESCERCE